MPTVWSPAGRWAAVSVVDSARPVEAVRADLLRRFAARARGPEAARDAARDEPAAGRLAFRDAGRLAFWRGRRLDLKDPELALLRGLTGAPGLDLTYRRARELLAAASGGGDEEDPARFRGLVQRLIEKFREVDPAFDFIAFLPRRGYRWDGPSVPEESSEESSGESSDSGATARSNLG